MKPAFFLLAILIVFPFLSSWSNPDSVRIEIVAPQLSGQKIFLCSYFNGLTYKQDSICLSSQGEGVFHQDKIFPEGQYLILLKNNLYIDFLLSEDQQFTIRTDTTDLLYKTQIEGAEQTEALLSYSQFINGEQKKRQKIIHDFRSLPEDKRDLAAAEADLAVLNEEVEKFQADFHARFKGKWVSLFLRSVEPVTTGPFPFPKTQAEYDVEFNYQKYHFFDNIDLQDRRFWWTNHFPGKVITYMEKQVEQIPDTLANAASGLLARTFGDSICFQLMLNKLVTYSSTSNIMGMENVWMKLVEDYYHKGLVTWGDSTHFADITFEYNKRRFNRIGMTAHDIGLQSVDGKHCKLYDLGKKYTLLYFYEPTCGHCIKTTPELYEKIYLKYAEKGLDIAAVYLYTDKKEWLDYIEKNRLKGSHWHNLWDPEHQSAFYLYYDTTSTPGIYLLDENKTIIAKKVDIATLDTVLGRLLP
ncbi:MAG: TlpA family protein disulfide reductase [Dysgonamonadaceae bacterium]|nr:TlpA family protein disulfide reductase [Dysgonamonadaceae bacterium]